MNRFWKLGIISDLGEIAAQLERSIGGGAEEVHRELQKQLSRISHDESRRSFSGSIGKWVSNFDGNGNGTIALQSRYNELVCAGSQGDLPKIWRDGQAA